MKRMQPRSLKLECRMTPKEKRALDTLASERGLTSSEAVRRLIVEEVTRVRKILDRKEDRYAFTKFRCLHCHADQAHIIPIGRKTIPCIDCRAVHKIAEHERKNTLKGE